MKIKVYQIVPERDKQNVKFTGLDELEKYQGGKAVNAALYEEVFDGEVDRTTLEGVYELLNIDIPPLHRGHSMSVSDVVKTDDGFYFCDRFGFQKTEFDEALATKPKNLVRVVYVEPGKPAYAAEIENTLRGIQRAVGGYIQTASNEDGTVIVCNEEGKLNSLPANRRLASDVLVGNFFVIGTKGADFRSLTDEETGKYLKRFATPEEIEEGEVEKEADIRFYPE
mgnify:FL=1